MLKTTPSASTRLDYTRPNENGLDKESGGRVGDKVHGRVDGGGIKNLSNIEKLAKSKKLDFVKTKLFKEDFLTFETKKAFIYLQKAFIKASILYYFDIKHHICIKTDALKYAIGRVLNQINLN